MKVERVVHEDNMPQLDKIVRALDTWSIEIGIFGEDDSFMLMVGTVNEFGKTITSKSGKYLTIPVSKKASKKKARDFKDAWTLQDKSGGLWLVRNKGKEEIEFLYMLAKQVVIPERSFIRGAFNEKGAEIDRFIELKLRDLLTFKISLDEFYNAVGEKVVSIIKKYMTDLKEPPKSPITLAANPNKNNPLINTGQLRNSIVWKIKRR